MPTETDMRLRSQLDANQRDREQMCRALLDLHPNYFDVKPRHPNGGPDGGRDLEATDGEGRLVFGAVGFKNSANDSSEQIKDIEKKFKEDAVSALKNTPQPTAFVFLTNVALTMGVQDALNKRARQLGFVKSEIFDRERLRIELDGVRGLFVRFQYLGVPLSTAEQASFLSQFGDSIQSVLATGFDDIQKSLRRLLFLKEAERTLGSIHVRFNLDREYSGEELGHCRAFALFTLKEIKHDIFMIYFGTSDRSARFYGPPNRDFRDQSPGIRHGKSGGQWEKHIVLSDYEQDSDEGAAEDDKEVPEKWISVGSSGGVGIEKTKAIVATYSHDSSLIRFQPRLSLMDLDEAMFSMRVSESLAGKIESVEIFANGYQIMTASEVKAHNPNKEDDGYPGSWTDEELLDPWKILRPATFSSFFRIDFFNKIPFRSFDYVEHRSV